METASCNSFCWKFYFKNVKDLDCFSIDKINAP